MTNSDKPERKWSYEKLRRIVESQFHGIANSLHGPRHWKRVPGFGLRIAEATDSNVEVVKLFALFHDSCRENDGHDPGHGARGAELQHQRADEVARRWSRHWVSTWT